MKIEDVLEEEIGKPENRVFIFDEGDFLYELIVTESGREALQNACRGKMIRIYGDEYYTWASPSSQVIRDFEIKTKAK